MTSKLWGPKETGVCLAGKWIECPNTDSIDSFSPSTGEKLSTITQIDRKTYDQMLDDSHEAFKKWRMVPAPQRGELIRDIGQALRENKQELGELISMEMGKILTEGLGEVQEAIDIADYAVGLSRQLYGVTTHSERFKHRMYEQWHPLGTIGIITAFNFPIAVWAWNAMIAAVCGDTMIWKPSSKVPLCAIATHKVILPVLKAHGCPGIMNIAVGKGSTFGSWMLKDRRIPLISATGSCNMGRKVGAEVGARLGRHVLELGGNNALIISPTANFENALRAICFGAIGTAGQRCTSTRRVFLHEDIYDKMLAKLKTAYESVKIGNPVDSSTLVGPLIDKGACNGYLEAVKKAQEQGGTLVTGGQLHTDGECAKGNYVKPTLIEATMDMPIVLEETFAPILYVFKYKNIEDAINMQNNVDQGLSSAIFTNDLLESERFLSHEGSDCGIANVNIGTSGAEIGLAFGGEKDTGGGREAGSDAWKQYMRRQANTINYGTELPLAQGVKFDI